MRLYRGIHAGLCTGVGALLVTTGAFAQDPAPEAAPEPAPAPAPAPAAEATAAPAEGTPATTANEEKVTEAVEEEGEILPKGLSFMAFADAYATMQTAQVGSPSPYHRAYDSQSPGLTAANGFSLAFGGLDVSYDSKYFGVTTSLRFGPGVPQFYAVDPVLGGIGGITQAYGTWKPLPMLSIDGGMFGTIYGAEVAESWKNLNYTRGALYYAMQPFWHTGLRANIALSESFTIKAMVVNDVNQISTTTNLQGGLQLAYAANDLGVAVGTLQTLGEGTSLGFDRFFDLVVTYMPGDFSLVFNGDLNMVDNGGTYYGLSLAAGYQFMHEFGLALRGELLDFDTSTADTELITGTLTVNVLPVPDLDNVVLRWDNRIETMAAGGAATNPFVNGSGQPTDAWFTSTVGMVVHTDGLF